MALQQSLPNLTSEDAQRSDRKNVGVQVDLTKCLGYGQCCFAAPDLFRMNGDESLEFVGSTSPEQLDAVRRAAAACPVQAISFGQSPTIRSEHPRSAKLGPRIVVVGASLAGLRAAEAACAGAANAHVTVIGEEDQHPYDRPPLSKALLLGRLQPDEVTLPIARDFDADWKLGCKAQGLDRGRKMVLLGNGEQLPYDKLVIATGARARPWPDPYAARLLGVITLRTLADAQLLRERLEARPQRVCVIGAGFIGTEVASTCRSLDLPVTLLERGEKPLARVLGGPIGDVVASLIRRHDIDLRLGVEVEAIMPSSEGLSVAGVKLTGGEEIVCDLVVVALGAVRNTEWLSRAGLKIDASGIAVDQYCRVLDEAGHPINDLFAAGDVTSWPSTLFDGERVAVEHWSNALEQGRCAGVNAIGAGPLVEHDYVPTFWSSQFGLNIKSVGLPANADSFIVVEGSLESGRFAAVYGQNGRTVAAVTFDHGRHMPFYVDLVRARAPYPTSTSVAQGPLHLP